MRIDKLPAAGRPEGSASEADAPSARGGRVGPPPDRGAAPPTRSAPPSTSCSARPESGWHGAERDELDPPRGPGRPRGARRAPPAAAGAARAAGRVGWISEGGLNYVCERLTVPPAEAYGVATFYAMFSVEPRPRHRRARLRRPRLPRRAAPSDLRRPRARLRPPRARPPRAATPPGCAARAWACASSAPAVLVQRAGVGAADSWRARGAAETVAALGRARADPRPTPAAGRRASPQTLGPRRPSGSGSCAASGVVDPALLRRLPRARGLRGAAPRGGAGRRGDDPRDHRRQADGPRRRGVPHRGEVEGRRRAARAPALLRLQRRRVRARHVQGPRRDGAGPVRGDRGPHDRGLRHRMRSRATSTSAASTRSRPSASSTRSRRRATAGSSATT